MQTLKEQIVCVLNNKKVKETPPKQVEIECRLGFLENRRFNPNIKENLYETAIEELSHKGFIMTEEETVDTFFSMGRKNIRNTQFILPLNKQDELITKDRIINKDIEIDSCCSHIRISAAHEMPIKKPAHGMGRPSYTRMKKRKSFVADIFSIDISEVTSQNKQKSYEIEIELTNFDFVSKNMDPETIASAFVERIQLLIACIHSA